MDTLAVAAKAERRAGTYETPVLYEEMADVYLALQGKDRLEHGPGKEMKVSIAYSATRTQRAAKSCQQSFLRQHGAG